MDNQTIALVIAGISVLVSITLGIIAFRKDSRKETKEEKEASEKALNEKLDTRFKGMETVFETNHLEHFRETIGNDIEKIGIGIEALKIDVGIIKSQIKEVEELKTIIGCMRTDMGEIMNDHASFTNTNRQLMQKVDAMFASVDELRSYDHIHSTELARHDERIKNVATLIERLNKKVFNGFKGNE